VRRLNTSIEGNGSGGARSTRYSALLIACSIVGLFLPFSSVASASVKNSSNSSSAGATKPDLAFFKGKTITYIIPNTPGTPDSQQAIAMQPGLEAYLDATINLEYLPGGSNYIGQNVLGSSAPDGLTIGDASANTDLNGYYSGLGQLNFPLQKASFIGATYSTPLLVVACTGSPITSFAQVASATTQISDLELPSGPATELGHFLLGAYNIPNRIISGYASPTAVVAGCERGDGEISQFTASLYANASETALAPGITPLLLTAEEPASSPLAFLNKLAPTITQFAKKHPGKTPFQKEGLKLAVSQFALNGPTYMTYAPTGVPKARVLALSDAMKAVMKEAAVKQALNVIGLPNGYVSPAAVLTYLKTGIDHETLIKRYYAFP
jgi:hypothetical protein